ncbi:MAG: CidA/LrgA family protein [Lachnospiraceae bacterium]|nr:CidA/LrgA family protein [Lachnospiraceae bacterium]
MKYIKQLLIILLVSFIAEAMEYFIPLPVAASVYGLILMLLGLMTHIIPLEKVEGTADYLVGIMALMFVPPTVGIMATVDELKQMGVALVVISAVTTLIIMVVTGKVAQFILNKKKKSEGGNGS